MPSVIRVYPKARRERQSSLRGIKAAVYTAMADQTAQEMNLRIDARIGGLC